MKVAFTILGDCVSMKNSRQIVHFGKRPALIKSAKARAYQDSVILQIPDHAKQMLEGPLKATVRVFYATWRKDVDVELVFDALAAKFEKQKGRLTKIGDGTYKYGEGERYCARRGVYLNDRQVRVKLIYGDVLDAGNPRVEIEIETMEPQQVSFIEDGTQDESEDEENGVTV